MIPRQLVAQCRRLKCRFGLGNALHAEVFNKQVRRGDHQPGDGIRKLRSVEQRDGAAITVPEQPGPVLACIYAQCLQKCW